MFWWWWRRRLRGRGGFGIILCAAPLSLSQFGLYHGFSLGISDIIGTLLAFACTRAVVSVIEAFTIELQTAAFLAETNTTAATSSTSSGSNCRWLGPKGMRIFLKGVQYSAIAMLLMLNSAIVVAGVACTIGIAMNATRKTVAIELCEKGGTDIYLGEKPKQTST